MMTKQNLFSVLLLCVLSMLLLFSSCKDNEETMDPCVEMTCENGGEKVKTSNATCECSCPPGYGGERCEMVMEECVGVECPEGQSAYPYNDCICQ